MKRTRKYSARPSRTNVPFSERELRLVVRVLDEFVRHARWPSERDTARKLAQRLFQQIYIPGLRRTP